ESEAVPRIVIVGQDAIVHKVIDTIEAGHFEITLAEVHALFLQGTFCAGDAFANIMATGEQCDVHLCGQAFCVTHVITFSGDRLKLLKPLPAKRPRLSFYLRRFKYSTPSAISAAMRKAWGNVADSPPST